MRKIAIVTGASRGIGRECAKALAKSGVTVIANYNKSEKQAKSLKEELEKENIQIDIFKADVTNKEEIKQMVEYTLNKYGKIDILVNNAGISQIKLFTDITDEDWETMIKTNLSSVFYMTREVLPNMIHNKNGCIINISSVWGIIGASCEVHYSSAKAGIIGMTKALAKEVGPSNIRVNAIAPGIIETDMNNELTKEELKELEMEIPLKKIGKPEQIANCVKWLVNDNYITGQTIKIDGRMDNRIKNKANQSTLFLQILVCECKEQISKTIIKPPYCKRRLYLYISCVYWSLLTFLL